MERREFGKSLVGGAVGAGIAGGLTTEQAAAQAARTLKPKKNLERSPDGRRPRTNPSNRYTVNRWLSASSRRR